MDIYTAENQLYGLLNVKSYKQGKEGEFGFPPLLIEPKNTKRPISLEFILKTDHFLKAFQAEQGPCPMFLLFGRYRKSLSQLPLPLKCPGPWPATARPLAQPQFPSTCITASVLLLVEGKCLRAGTSF